MNSEKEFKDKLKEKLKSKEFQFDETNWEQARQLIDASREEKKRVILPYILFGLFFIGSGIFGFYIFNSPEKTTGKELAVNSNKTSIPVEEAKTVISETKKSTVSTNNKMKNVVVATTEKPKPGREITKTKNLNKKSKNSTQVNSAKRKINNTQNTHQTKNIAVTIPKRKIKKQKDQLLAVTSKKEKKTSETLVPEEKNSNENTETVNEAAATIPAVVTTEPVKNIEPETVKTKTLEPEPLVETKPTVNAATDSAAKPMAIENTTTAPVHFISLEAGTNYLFGWNNHGKKDANGFNPVIGLNYSNVIAKQTTLSFGIQYTMVRNLSYSNYAVTTTRYNFGEESDVMVFTPTTMHYLVVPVRISYSLDQKNVFGLACNVGYLFHLNSNVELYSQHAGQKGNSTILKTSGYTQGFKTFDTQLAIFYRRNLGKDLWLHTEFMYGLTDVKDNTFFKSNINERNIGVKLTLIYNLFKK